MKITHILLILFIICELVNAFVDPNAPKTDDANDDDMIEIDEEPEPTKRTVRVTQLPQVKPTPKKPVATSAPVKPRPNATSPVVQTNKQLKLSTPAPVTKATRKRDKKKSKEAGRATKSPQVKTTPKNMNGTSAILGTPASVVPTTKKEGKGKKKNKNKNVETATVTKAPRRKAYQEQTEEPEQSYEERKAEKKNKKKKNKAPKYVDYSSCEEVETPRRRNSSPDYVERRNPYREQGGRGQREQTVYVREQPKQRKNKDDGTRKKKSGGGGGGGGRTRKRV